MSKREKIINSLRTISIYLLFLVVPLVMFGPCVYYFFSDSVSDLYHKRAHPQKYLTDRVSQLEAGIRFDEDAIKKYTLEIEKIQIEKQFDGAKAQRLAQIDPQIYEYDPQIREYMKEVSEKSYQARKDLYKTLIISKRNEIARKKKEIDHTKSELAKWKRAK